MDDNKKSKTTTNDPTQLYLNQLSESCLLTAEEEVFYA
ncbi:MAG: sigma-70 factor domain-containing protein, partial [Cycloclasticus pugetii]